jgi:heptosyltransferase III
LCFLWLVLFLPPSNHKVMAKGDAGEHRVCQLARLFDLQPPPPPRLWTAPPHEQAASALIAPGHPVLAIGPAANWRGKEWRAERFAELALRLTAAAGPLSGFRVAVLAALNEREQAEPLLAAIPADRRIDLVGRIDLLTAAAVLRRCAMFIGNDTGLMHLAAAANTPTLGLFGPSPVTQYAPWGRHTAYVRSVDPPEAMFGPGFDHRTTGTLMDGLSVGGAESAAIELWHSVGSAAA